MSFAFHIIYTPNTVKPLQLLLSSLLKWSDCTFRLVANGCDAQEQQMLQQMCGHHARLTYQSLPSRQVMVHGDALNYLQAQNQDEYFCFMDSDIYAVAPFMAEFRPHVEQYSGIFSGMPLRYPQSGVALPVGKAFLAGPYSHTTTGICLGATFFAIYHNQVITEIRRTTGMGFTKYRWEALPPAYQTQIAALGLRHERYDTAKVLNLLLHLHGYRLRQQPCSALRHIEAVSRFAVLQSTPWWRQWRIRLGRLGRHIMGQRVKVTYDQALPYLSQLLVALANGQPAPNMPPQITQSSPWVVQAQQELLDLHAEFVQVQAAFDRGEQ